MRSMLVWALALSAAKQTRMADGRWRMDRGRLCMAGNLREVEMRTSGRGRCLTGVGGPL
jgi:hypothetical protein